MATIARLKLRPIDHGRPISYEDFMASDTVDGYHYEIIDGKIYVSPMPNTPHMRLDKWMFSKPDRYSSLRPRIVNMVYNKCRVYVPGRENATCPEPDIAAYHDYPLAVSFKDI